MKYVQIIEIGNEIGVYLYLSFFVSLCLSSSLAVNVNICQYPYDFISLFLSVYVNVYYQYDFVSLCRSVSLCFCLLFLSYFLFVSLCLSHCLSVFISLSLFVSVTLSLSIPLKHSPMHVGGLAWIKYI